jgi:pimeloyl-ACP methyl ester carboxylesterase
MITVLQHYAPNHDGWLLHLRQAWDPDRLQPDRPPVLLLPGYGMNAFIFSYHPRGTSMERALAEAGLEVWSVNLRHQGHSRPMLQRPPAPSMRAYADMDLTAAITAVLAKTRTTAVRVSLVGCSLGGSIAFAHLALRDDDRVAGMVAIGSPLRWLDVPALFRVALASPRLVGMVPVVGSRQLLGGLFPLLSRVPGMLDIYLNPAHVDIEAARELVRTVDDPHPAVNREVARWIQRTDLVLRGVNVSEALSQVDLPLLVMVSNRDGIVPRSTALSVLQCWGGRDVTTLEIGDDGEWFAHADLFIANTAPDKVFAPLSQWLLEHPRA